MYITVETLEGSADLIRHEYTFYVRAESGSKKIEVLFDGYVRRERETRRHRTWGIVAQWSRKVGPNPQRMWREVPEPTLSPRVREMVEHAFRKSVRFPWSL